MPEFITHATKNLNQYYIISYLFIMPMNTFLIATKGEKIIKADEISDWDGLLVL